MPLRSRSRASGTGVTDPTATAMSTYQCKDPSATFDRLSTFVTSVQKPMRALPAVTTENLTELNSALSNARTCLSNADINWLGWLNGKDRACMKSHIRTIRGAGLYSQEDGMSAAYQTLENLLSKNKTTKFQEAGSTLLKRYPDAPTLTFNVTALNTEMDRQSTHTWWSQLVSILSSRKSQKPQTDAGCGDSDRDIGGLCLTLNEEASIWSSLLESALSGAKWVGEVLYNSTWHGIHHLMGTGGNEPLAAKVGKSSRRETQDESAWTSFRRTTEGGEGGGRIDIPASDFGRLATLDKWMSARREASEFIKDYEASQSWFPPYARWRA